VGSRAAERRPRSAQADTYCPSATRDATAVRAGGRLQPLRSLNIDGGPPPSVLAVNR